MHNISDAIKKIDEEIEALESKNKIYKDEASDQIDIVCNKCDESFVDKKSLKLHMTNKHKQIFQCDTCDKTFAVRYQLENHMKEHMAIKEYKCEQCNLGFFLKWRLNKHVKGHSTIEQKFCHYFNNEKNCPFEEMGCKFKHGKSENCKFGQMCENKLCQYRHTGTKKKDIDALDDSENIKAPEEETENVEDNALTDALDRIKELEENKSLIENKLKIYGATIKKLANEKKSSC